MEPERITDRYAVRPLTPSDIPAVLALCRGNPQYYRHCPPEPSEEGVLAMMCALPPRVTAERKHFIGFYDGPELTAVMDLIDGYPAPRTAFIGFFMVAREKQGRGAGSALVSDLCRYLEGNGYEEIRLGWVASNLQAAGFWRKNGFSETGLSYETDRYTVTVARRRLAPWAAVR